MENVKYITVNGFDFIVTDEVDYNNNHYLLAIDENGENTITVLKQKTVDGEEVVESVFDEDEIQAVLTLIKRKND